MADRIFEENLGLIGNEKTIGQLRNKLKSGRLPQAMIFSGPEGVGKRTSALRIASSINCLGTATAPCNSCKQCLKVTSGTHPDVMTITVTPDASQVKIEQIRNILQMINLEPFEGKAKFFLIDPADKMTTGASNALLKAMEEPPARTYFILITQNVNELLVTIRSRSQIYHFVPLTLPQIRLSGIKDELIVRWSAGSIGRSIDTDPTLLRERRDMIFTFLEKAMNAQEEELAKLLTGGIELSRAKHDYPEFLLILGILVSDLILIFEGLDHRIVNIDIETKLKELVTRTTINRLVQIADCIKFIESNFKSYLNRQLTTDFLSLTLNETTGKFLAQNS